MQVEDKIKLLEVLSKSLRFIFFICFLLLVVYWGVLTEVLFFSSIFFPSHSLIGGIEARIWHVFSDISYSANQNRMLMDLSMGYLTYILVLLTIFFISFLYFLWKRKKKDKSEKRQEKIYANKFNKIVKLFIYACIFTLTIFWCFYTIKLLSHLIHSSFGIESIIKNEASLNISNEQPLFVNNEIQGITFDEAARVISIFYLKYIGLLYLEGMSLFAFIYMLKQRKEKLEIKT